MVPADTSREDKDLCPFFRAEYDSGDHDQNLLQVGNAGRTRVVN